MIKLEADSSKNLLTIRYAGAVGPAEVKSGLDDVRAGLAQLRQNFRLLADLSELQSMDVACAPFIEKAMDMCNEKGASIVVRVIPDPRRDIGLQIMSIFHYAPEVRIINCETLVQAEEILRAE
jgi:anti-anti-sigma regulatory factor